MERQCVWSQIYECYRLAMENLLPLHFNFVNIVSRNLDDAQNNVRLTLIVLAWIFYLYALNTSAIVCHLFGQGVSENFFLSSIVGEFTGQCLLVLISTDWGDCNDTQNFTFFTCFRLALTY
eukprot:GHVT01019815.1.p1 GENE.GHVT01019815.1~~GHVT01019815.1.p1  ORF type:complete len:121 (+),score=2.38 GHVT01019815.1:584-946(+)